MRALVFLTILFTPAPAFAYFDPGTGSLIIQAVVGAMAGMAVFGRQIKEYITRKFSGNKHNPLFDERDTEIVNDGHTDIAAQDENKL